MERNGRLEVLRRGAPIARWAVAPEGGVIVEDFANTDMTIVFTAPAIDPPPAPPPRELESMSTAEVAEYLAKRIREEADERPAGSTPTTERKRGAVAPR